MVGWEGHLDGKNAAVQNVVVARQPIVPIGRDKATALHLVP
jgi:hypothetical protein